MTNYERIKSMSIEEMSEFLGFFNAEEDICSMCSARNGSDYCRTHSCVDCAKKYLEKDGAKGEDHTDNT